MRSSTSYSFRFRCWCFQYFTWPAHSLSPLLSTPLFSVMFALSCTRFFSTLWSNRCTCRLITSYPYSFRKPPWNYRTPPSTILSHTAYNLSSIVCFPGHAWNHCSLIAVSTILSSSSISPFLNIYCFIKYAVTDTQPYNLLLFNVQIHPHQLFQYFCNTIF